MSSKHDEEERDEQEEVAKRLRQFGQQRRIWRPTVKLVLGGSIFISKLMGIIVFFCLTFAMSKKFSIRNQFVPMILLIIMEMATDISDSFVTEMLQKTPQPGEVLYALSAALIMGILEIFMWTCVVKFYEKCNCGDGRN